MAGEAYQVGTNELTEIAAKMRGHVTCFEGVDGAGKTTIAKWFQAEFGRVVPPTDIVLVREPGGTDVGESIRTLLLHGSKPTDHAAGRSVTRMHAMTETLLFFAARAELYDAVIRPAIAAKKIVLADRCLYSTIAYQCFGLAPSRDYEFAMDHVLEIAELTLPKISAISMPSRSNPTLCSRPSFAVVLDIDPETRKARMDKNLDDIESRGWDFFERVRDGYLAVANHVPNVALVNAAASLDAVKALCVAELRRFFVPSF